MRSRAFPLGTLGRGFAGGGLLVLPLCSLRSATFSFTGADAKAFTTPAPNFRRSLLWNGYFLFYLARTIP